MADKLEPVRQAEDKLEPVMPVVDSSEQGEVDNWVVEVQPKVS